MKRSCDFLSGVAAWAWMAGAMPQSPPALPESVIECATETDSSRRLACYDREIARYREVRAARVDARPAERSSARPEAVRRDDPKPDPLTAKVTSTSRKPFGELVFTLDNGQVWAEASPSGLDVQVGDAVTISSGWFGSFHLSTPDRRSTKVSRVK